MRKPRHKKTKVDLLVPVTLEASNDCFGTEEYNPRTSDCALCHDIELCGIKFQEILQAQKKHLEQEKGPFLDMVDTSSIDWVKIKARALEYQQAGEPLSYEELRDALMKVAKIKDEDTFKYVIDKDMPDEMYIENDIVYVREDTSN